MLNANILGKKTVFCNKNRLIIKFFIFSLPDFAMKERLGVFFNAHMSLYYGTVYICQDPGMYNTRV
jgi:hypothetical protein